MKEENNKKAGYYDRLIVRVVEQSNKMQKDHKKAAPERAREVASEVVSRLKAEFQVFENELRAAREACLIDVPVKEAECLDEAYKKFLHLGFVINKGPISEAAKEGYFRELRVIGRMIDSLMGQDEVIEHELQKAEGRSYRGDEGPLDARWEARLREKIKDEYKKNRGH